MAGSSMSERLSTAEGQRGRPLLVTENEEVLDDLLRLCAAAGAEVEVAHGAPERKETWDSAPLILVGDDCATRLRGLPRREGVLLVGRELDDPGIWRRAVDIGADNVAILPDAEPWLVDRIADVAEGLGDQAFTVAVVGGRGGAGASTLACALAVTAARAGQRTMLIDGDPLGGGLDILLGGEGAEGLRWPAFAESRGRVAASALEDSLPELHSLRVLSWDRGDTVTIPCPAMRAVVAAARRRGGVVVIDLPRRVDDAVVEALKQTDLGLLVVPAELRAVAAADRVATTVRMVLADLRLVVRGPCRSGLGDEEIARLLALPLAGEVPAEPALPETLGSGDPPGLRARGPLARFCAEFWERALPVEGGGAA